MTTLLHLRARPAAPVVCDMSTAQDTPAERLRDYARLFERALLRRERRADAVVFRFRDEPSVREAVGDLARREAACCPFLEYRIEVVGDEVVWTMTNAIAGDRGAAADAVLDAFHDLPGPDRPGVVASLGLPSVMPPVA